MNWCGPWVGDSQNGTDPLVVSEESHPIQRVRPYGLSSVSQLADQNFIQCFPKETSNFSLNQEKEGGQRPCWASNSHPSSDPLPAAGAHVAPSLPPHLPGHLASH